MRVLLLLVFITICDGAFARTETTIIECPGGSYQILETIPPDLKLPFVGANSTYGGFLRALNDAKSSVSIAALWAELIAPSYAQHEANVWRGEVLNQEFERLSATVDMELSLVTNNCELPGHMFSCQEVEQWQKEGVFNITLDDWSTLASTDKQKAWGVLHAKVFVVDEKHAYSGSANLAYGSFSQTKELGLMFFDCAGIAEIHQQINSLWSLAGNLNHVPTAWPEELLPKYNSTHRISTKLLNSDGDEEHLELFPCYSPPPLNYETASDCTDVLVDHILAAEKFIQISLMDYSPTTLYQSLASLPETYWDTLDRALRLRAFSGVQVELLVSNWTRTFAAEQPYWRSLDVLPNVHVKQFRMPAVGQVKALSRVNHPKYMVTDKVAYVGTSNWSEDYFAYFAGLGMSIQGENSVAQKLRDVFHRDWTSAYAVDLFY